MDYSLEKKLRGFKQIAQEKLQKILCSIPNQKDLIIEGDLIKPLEHVCVASWVRSKGVHKIYRFDQKNMPPSYDKSLVYLISANLLIFKHVLDQIHEHSKHIPAESHNGINKNYHVIVLPDVYSSFVTLLEEEGLYGLVSLYRFHWDFVYLDESVMSLEIPQAFTQLFIQKDSSILPSIAHSLRIFNMIFGKPELIITYGKYSDKILDIIERLETSGNNEKSPDFNIMLIIDRNIDFPSCLLTPAIYSGLLLEVFKYRSGELEIQTNTNKISNGKLDIFKLNDNDSNKKNSTSTIRMNGQYDEIFGDNRYKHFSEASNLVRSQAKALGLEVQNLNKMKLSEMHDYVSKKLPKIAELKSKIIKHLNACEQIINELAGNFQKQQLLEEDILNNTSRKQILSRIDEILTVDAHKYNTIRVLCLVHISIGLNSDELSTFIRNYCNVFGHKYLYIFLNLANAELLPSIDIINKTKLLQNLQIPRFQQTEFQMNANRLKLLTPIAGAAGSNDTTKSHLKNLCPSYTFNGSYIPLVAQLSSILLKAENIDEISTKLSAIEKIKIHTSDSTDKKTIKQFQQCIKRGETNDKFPLQQRNLFIFFVGGVTYAEIAACNLISKLTNSKIVVASSHICSGCDLIVSAF